MDWSNERYVRIYTRDTITWKRLGWEGQTVLLHTIRRIDRSGVLDLNGVSAAEAIELVTDLPAAVIEVGLKRCLDPEIAVFEVDGDRLLMPNFLDAQEAVASNAERQRRWRAKKRNEPSTYSNGNETSTESNGIVSTVRNGASTAVDKNNPVLNQPCLTRGTNRAIPNQVNPRACARGDSPPSKNNSNFDETTLAEIISDVRRSLSVFLPHLTPYVPKATDLEKRRDAVAEILAIAAAEGVDPEGVATVSYSRFLRSDEKWLRDRGFPLGSWVAQVGHYYRPPAEKTEHDRASTYARDNAESDRKEKETAERLAEEDPQENLEAMQSARKAISKLTESIPFGSSTSDKLKNFQEKREELRAIFEKEPEKQ